LNQTINNRQITFIIFSYIVGYGVIALPKNVVKYLGTGGWITIIIGDLVMIFSAYLFIYLGKTFNKKTIYEYSRILTGKFISYFILISICIYCLLSSAIVTRLSSETIKLSVLINTPSWVLASVLFIVCYYTLVNELKILGRIFEVFTIIVIINILPLHLGMLTQGELINLKPVFMLKDTNSIIKTLPNVIMPFIGIEILSVIPIDKIKNKDIFKYVAYMLIFIGLLYIIIVESCVCIMGVKSLVHYEDALFASIRRIEIEYLQFLKRLDSVFIVVWIINIYSTIVLGLYIVVQILSKIFSSINRNIIVFITVLVSFILCMIPNTMDSMRHIYTVTGYCGMLIILIVPLILCIITLIKKYLKRL
jgi:spore germination protein